MRSPKSWYWAVVVAMVIAAMAIAATVTGGPAILSAQTAEPSAVQGTDPMAATTEVEIQRRFNELRRELLDDRADTINWWLAATAIFLTLIGIVAPIAAYIGFNRLQGIEAEARVSVKQARRSAEEAEGHVEETRKNAVEAEGHVEETRKNAVEAEGHVEETRKNAVEAEGHVEEARRNAVEATRYVEDIRKHREQSEEDTQRIRDNLRKIAEDIQDYQNLDKPEEIEGSAQEDRDSPDVSLLHRATAEAYSLQEDGRIEEAIEKWRSIASVAEGIDDGIAAHAWFSVGYLLQEGRHGESSGN